MENIKKVRRIKQTPYILILGFSLSLILGIMSGKIFTSLVLWLVIFSWIYSKARKIVEANPYEFIKEYNCTDKQSIKKLDRIAKLYALSALFAVVFVIQTIFSILFFITKSVH